MAFNVLNLLDDCSTQILDSLSVVHLFKRLPSQFPEEAKRPVPSPAQLMVFCFIEIVLVIKHSIAKIDWRLDFLKGKGTFSLKYLIMFKSCSRL